MIKKENIKSEFERIVRANKQRCFDGYRRACTYFIEIIGRNPRSVIVALSALPLGSNSFVVARSYPMSYKSAHRLVCSL